MRNINNNSSYYYSLLLRSRPELKTNLKEEENIANRLDRLYDILETGYIKINDLIPRIRELKNRQEQSICCRCELETCLLNKKQW